MLASITDQITIQRVERASMARKNGIEESSPIIAPVK